MDLKQFKGISSKVEKLKRAANDLAKEIEKIDKSLDKSQYERLQSSIISSEAASLAIILRALDCNIDFNIQSMGDDRLKYRFVKRDSYVLVQEEVMIPPKPISKPKTTKKTTSKIAVNKRFGNIVSIYGYRQFLEEKGVDFEERENCVWWIRRLITRGYLNRYSYIFEKCVSLVDYKAGLSRFLNEKCIDLMDVKSDGILQKALSFYIGYISSDDKSMSISSKLKRQIVDQTRSQQLLVAEDKRSPQSKTFRINKLVNEFVTIKTYRRGKIRSPHKAVLLITLLNNIRDGKIKENKIFLNDDLIDQFIFYWDKLVPITNSFSKNICSPFINLDSDPFYNLVLKRKITDKSILTSQPVVNRYVDYAVLREDLFLLSQIPETCKMLIECLITIFELNKLEDGDTDNLKSSPKTVKLKKIPNIYGFTSFLRSYRDKSTSKGFQQSEINRFIYLTRTKKLEQFIEKYEPNGDLFRIIDNETISNLSYDIGQGSTDTQLVKRLMNVLNLYQEYLNSLK